MASGSGDDSISFDSNASGCVGSEAASDLLELLGKIERASGGQ
jgi:hypothetical protein